ncbi:hypothetical protein CI238_10116 [Colletotrichum incanum]|uniref:Uncharacterized protein n=1 Tax=Colletotrichum incanum TaxID=1573173 RepID=A0A167BN44_COLIC|nr:hypothetical protein CI238_10116 [Colletotrichum incanum]
MPTTTYLSQVGISNIGPLTTVFTAPAACATSAHPLWLGYTFEGSGSGQSGPLYAQNCDVYPLGECYPSGSALDVKFSSVLDAGGRTDFGTIAYFSPASQCPHGHTTVGVLAKNDAGQVSSSGAFSTPLANYEGEVWLPQNPPVNIFIEALDKGETVVLCCPENYTALDIGGCFSQVPLSKYGEMTACGGAGAGTDGFTWVNATFTCNNTRYTGEVISLTATSNPPLSYTTTPILSVIGANTVAYEERLQYTLVHRPADATTGGGSGAAVPTETAPSGAPGWRMTTSGGGVGVLSTVWAFAALVGVSLIAPW